MVVLDRVHVESTQRLPLCIPSLLMLLMMLGELLLLLLLLLEVLLEQIEHHRSIHWRHYRGHALRDCHPSKGLIDWPRKVFC